MLRDRAAARRLLELADEHEHTLRRAEAGELDLAEHWTQRLAALLPHAARSSVYAGDAAADWRGVAQTLSQAAPGEALDAYVRTQPLLEKARVREAGLRALARPFGEIVQYFESSGSTGDATPAPKSWDDYLRNTINIARGWERAFAADSIALLLINAPFAPAPAQFQRVVEYLGMPFMRPWVDNVSGDYGRVLRLIDELGVDTFIGPPSRLQQLIEASERHRGALVGFRTLLLMAEQCGPAFRGHLQRLTGARPLQGAYGASETGTVAVGCEAGQLHVQLHSFIVELLDGDGATTIVTDELTGPHVGELVVTTLDLHLRPLLRFRTGDRVTIAPARCECGRRLPVLITHGRAVDRLVLEDLSVRQEEVEQALWREPDDDVAALNYLLVVDEDEVRCLVTARQDTPCEVHEAMAERLREISPGLRWSVSSVESLPAVATLGQFLGWKMSRVLDARDRAAVARFPGFVRRLVDEAYAIVDAG